MAKVKVTKYEAQWCGPCKALTPIWNKVASELQEADFEVVDIDTHSEQAANAGVRAVPTIIIEKDGEVFEQLIGLVKEDVLKELITRAFS